MGIFTIEFLLLSMMLLLLGCESAGTIQSEDTGVAILVDEAGQPVVNASVRVFKYRDSTGIYEDSIATNEKGEYSFNQKLAAGRYTIWAETDTSVLYREDLIIAPDSLFQDQDTLKPSRNIVVPVKVEPNHDPRTVEVQIWGTPIRHNVTESGHLILNKIANGTYFTRLTTQLDGYTPTNDTIVIDESSVDDSLHLPDTLKDTLKLIYTGIPVVSGFTHTYDTLNTTVNLTWDQTDFANIQAYVIERKLKSETVWPAAPLAHVYVSQASHPVTYNDVVSVGETGAVYQYRIKILDNSSLIGAPFGVLEVIAPPASSATTTITATSMQKAKGIVGNRASINDIMSFTVNFSNPSRKLTKIDWFEGTTLLKTTPLTDLIISDSFEKSWPAIGAKSLTVQITDDAGKVWKKEIPVSIVEDKPVISFVDTTINLNVLDTLTAIVSDEFGEIVSYQWDLDGDGVFEKETTAPFVEVHFDSLLFDKIIQIKVIDDDENDQLHSTLICMVLEWEFLNTIKNVKQLELIDDVAVHNENVILIRKLNNKNMLIAIDTLGNELTICDSMPKSEIPSNITFSNQKIYYAYELPEKRICLSESSDGKLWNNIVDNKYSEKPLTHYFLMFSKKSKLYFNCIPSENDSINFRFGYWGNGEGWVPFEQYSDIHYTIKSPNLENYFVIPMFYTSGYAHITIVDTNLNAMRRYEYPACQENMDETTIYNEYLFVSWRESMSMTCYDYKTGKSFEMGLLPFNDECLEIYELNGKLYAISGNGDLWVTK